MTTQIPLSRFEHACSVRGKTHSTVCAEAGVSSATVAKIRRGQPVSLATALKLSHYFASIAPLPQMVDLLGATAESAGAKAPGYPAPGVPALSRVAS